MNNYKHLDECQPIVQYSPQVPLVDIEVQYIKQALIYHNNHKTNTARSLRISVRKLRDVIYNNEQLKEFRYYKDEHNKIRCTYNEMNNISIPKQNLNRLKQL